jgi:hypothetical protein
MKVVRLVLLLLVAAMQFQTSAAQTSNSVKVILWFDTEDYLSPADDDATKHLCEMLTQRGIRATFKLVGEKARVLERRGRTDVITALKKHAIGYHANFHSVHPTPTEYLADCGWLDGVQEFARREGPGAADVRRILQVPTLACYGQPGSSWAPQAIAALQQIGVTSSAIPCYLDEGSHVGIDNRPFWYCGALNVYHLGPNVTRMELHDPNSVAPAERKVAEIAQRLRAEGGGLISIFYHPCEWIHLQFWDGVNFARGSNPPREQWQSPPQRTAGETEAAFQRFGQYIDSISALNVRWITASELPGLYPDKVRSEGATKEDLDELARRIIRNRETGLNYESVNHRIFSLADQFELLAAAAESKALAKPLPLPIKTKGLIGPDAPPPASQETLTNLDWPRFRDALRDVAQFIEQNGRVPARVFIGSDPMAPADFLVGMAAVWLSDDRSNAAADRPRVPLGRHVKILPERHVAADTPDLFGGWIIHKEGFRAPKVMEQARLQAWTLKPAEAAKEKSGFRP